MIRTVVSNIYLITLLLLGLLSATAAAQTISIDSLYSWAENNYPLIKRSNLIKQTETYNIENLSRGYLPQVNVIAQATYQSEVTSLPISNIGIEPLSKDQYKTYVDISQVLYDGGVVDAQRQLQKVSSALETANLQRDLYLIRERINQIFFGALLLQNQTALTNILINQLSETKARVDSAIKNGSAFKSDADQLQSEILIQQQRTYDLQSGIASYLQMLIAFGGRKISSVDILERPADKTAQLIQQNNRPELKAFDVRNQLYDKQIDLLKSRIKPRLGLFGQGGYGKPGLNQLKNNFDWFYLAGVRINWNFSALYTFKNEKSLIKINKYENGVQRETFLFNNNITQIQQDNEKVRNDKLLATDEEIIRLKESIRESAKAKYENGVITLNDYLKEINAVNQAKLNLELHKIQALSNQYNRRLTTGN